jgi:hypothetical protein
VKTLRQSVGILLVSVILGYPAMACLTLGVEMTAAERECCKQMAQQCGSMKMPASHSCCQTEVRQPHSMLHVATTQIAPPVATQVAVIDAPTYSVADADSSFFELHRPPESPPGSSSILRI